MLLSLERKFQKIINSLAYVYSMAAQSSKLIISAVIILRSLCNAHTQTHTHIHDKYAMSTLHTYNSPWTMCIFWMRSNIISASPFAVVFWLKTFYECVHRNFHGVFSTLVIDNKKAWNTYIYHRPSRYYKCSRWMHNMYGCGAMNRNTCIDNVMLACRN